MRGQWHPSTATSLLSSEFPSSKQSALSSDMADDIMSMRGFAACRKNIFSAGMKAWKRDRKGLLKESILLVKQKAPDSRLPHLSHSFLLWNNSDLPVGDDCHFKASPENRQRRDRSHIHISLAPRAIKTNLPGSLSAGSSSDCCTSLCQSKALPRACPGSPDLCRSGKTSLSLSWTLVSCRWIPSGRICSAFWRSEAAHCSSPPVGCWCLRTGCSTVHRTWAAACVDSGSGSAGWKTTYIKMQWAESKVANIWMATLCCKLPDRYNRFECIFVAAEYIRNCFRIVLVVDRTFPCFITNTNFGLCVFYSLKNWKLEPKWVWGVLTLIKVTINKYDDQMFDFWIAWTEELNIFRLLSPHQVLETSWSTSRYLTI